MTVDEVLEQVERQKPNAVEERLKRGWVLELEKRNWEEMLCEDEEKREHRRIGEIDPGADADKPKGAQSAACLSAQSEGLSPRPCVQCEREKEQSGLCEDALRIPTPYDQAYVLYVIAMIEFVTQEYAGYQNTMTLFNSVMDAYKAWYRRRHRPKRSRIAL